VSTRFLKAVSIHISYIHKNLYILYNKISALLFLGCGNAIINLNFDRNKMMMKNATVL